MSGADPTILAEPIVAVTGDATDVVDAELESGAGTREHNQAIVTGVLWQGTLRWLAQVLSWTATIVIARRLSPQDYGIAGTATVLFALLALVTEGGIGRALVMLRERGDVITRQAHGASITAGVAVATLMCLAAYPLGLFYNEPRVAPLIAVLSVGLVLTGINAVPIAVMMQDLQYRRLAAMDFGKAIVQGVVVMIGAVSGFGPWALVAGLLAGYLAVTLMARQWVSLRPLRPSRDQLTPVVRYASHLVVGAFAWFLYSNADFAVVGRVAGLAALGYYQFAWNVAQLPGEKLANVLQAVVGPFFGAIGNDIKSLRHYFLLLSELLVSVMLPVLAGFALVAHVAVPLIFGDKWMPAVPVMEILVISSALSSISMLSQHVLVATGHASASSRVNMIAALVMPICFYVAARNSGTLAVAAVWLVAQPVLMTLPLLHVRRAIGLPVRTYFRCLRAPAFSVLVMTGCVLLVGRLTTDLSPLARLIAMCVTGALVYPITFRALFAERVSAMQSVWKSRA